MQVENFALAREEIVFDVEAVHGFEMATKDGGRDQLGDGSRLTTGVFDGAQGLRTDLQVLFVLFFAFTVPLRDAGVEIPAVIVEVRLAGERFDFGAGFFLDVGETDNYVGNLHSGVVDVVLDVDFPARVTQQADESVSEDGVAQVTDVGGLVRIDAGVLDQNFARRNIGRRILAGDQDCGHGCAVDAGVQISGAGDFELVDTFDCAEACNNFFRDFARGLAQFLRQLKGERQRVFTELDLGRLFDDDGLEFETVGATQESAHGVGQSALKMTIQGVPLNC